MIISQTGVNSQLVKLQVFDIELKSGGRWKARSSQNSKSLHRTEVWWKVEGQELSNLQVFTKNRSLLKGVRLGAFKTPSFYIELNSGGRWKLGALKTPPPLSPFNLNNFYKTKTIHHVSQNLILA